MSIDVTLSMSVVSPYSDWCVLVCTAPSSLFGRADTFRRRFGMLNREAKGRRPKKSLWLAVQLSESVHEKWNGSEGPKQTIKKANLRFHLTPALELLAGEWKWNAHAICCLFISRSLFFFSRCITQSVFRLLPLLNDEYTQPTPAGKESYCHRELKASSHLHWVSICISPYFHFHWLQCIAAFTLNTRPTSNMSSQMVFA